ncbi:MAG: hypothetical protein JWN34_3770 [Bryobacterales bacterium]|nr:hypothetical protein [Bryobacterales bacterium]
MSDAPIDSPYEAGSPEDYVYVSAIYGNSAAHQRQINAAEGRILARQAADSPEADGCQQ